MAETQPSPSQPEDECKLLGEDLANTEDAFGHDEIVEALTGAILAARPPFSIGLVGEWGVGKSFVLRKLEQRLKKDEIKQKGVEVFYFDAWKYAGESIKRSLLERLLRERRLSDTKQGKEWLIRLYTTQQKPSRPVLGISWGLALNRGVIPLAIGIGVYALFKWGLEYQPISAFATGAIVGLLSLAVSVFNNITQVAWETFSIPPIASAEKFEEIFEEFLKEVLGEPDDKRAVILIDELDRCDAKTRAEVLQGLRTYLQNKRCIYVVACAPKSLRQGSSDSASELPDEEFLRKLFNLTCWIDPQGEENLRKYAARCLKEAGVRTDTRDLVQIVVLGNTRNPRRIRHFLNTLYFALRVASAREEKKEEDGGIPKGIVTGNKAFLAKVLILRQDWPKEFGEIVREPRKLRQWTESESPDNIDPDLLRFLYRTDQFMVKDPRPFFAVTMGATATDLKPNADLIKAFFARDTETAKSMVKTMPQEDYPAWSDLLCGELRQSEASDDYQFYINGVVVACALLECVPEDREQGYIEEICDFMEPERINKLLPAPMTSPVFSPQTAKDVFPLALKARLKPALKILNYYSFIEASKIHPVIGEVLEEHAQKITIELRNAINESLLKTWRQIIESTPGHLGLLNSYKEWPKSEEDIEYLVSPDMVKALLETYDQQVRLLMEASQLGALELKETLYDVLYRLRPAWDESVNEKVVDSLFRAFPDKQSEAVTLNNEQVQSLKWMEKFIVNGYVAVQPEKSLRLLWKNFQSLESNKDVNSPSFRSEWGLMKVALWLNLPPPAEILPDLKSILDHYVKKLSDDLPAFGLSMRMGRRFYHAEDTLTDFLTSSLIGGGYDYSFAPAFISVLFSLERWPEVGQCLHHLFRSNDANSLFDQAMRECLGRVFALRELSLKRLFEIVEELGETNRFASCDKFLSAVADLCPDMGAANELRDIQFGEFLFEKLFQFMPNPVKLSFADKYLNTLHKSASELTEKNLDFLGWIKNIWNYFSSTSRVRVLEKLGYLARPDALYEMRISVDQILQTVIALSETGTERPSSLVKELVKQSTSEASDRAACLRAAAMIMARTSMKIAMLEEEIKKLETSSDDNLQQLAAELEMILSRNVPL